MPNIDSRIAMYAIGWMITGLIAILFIYRVVKMKKHGATKKRIMLEVASDLALLTLWVSTFAWKRYDGSLDELMH